jgi:O-acetyl-ADP-ribose deacetylase (regulator of RNase III)
MYKEVEGDLISMAKLGQFDVISHGCNCFSNMGAGIAPKMNKAFGVGMYPMEDPNTAGDINKLGCIDFKWFPVTSIEPNTPIKKVAVVNSYSQYAANVLMKPLDYEALTLCMRKINHKFKGLHVGLPKIGAGLAGGSWERIKVIIQTELKDCDVTIVMFNPNSQ